MTISQFNGTGRADPDLKVEERIEKHCEEFGISPLDAVKLFPVLGRRQWLKRFMAHHELFLKTIDVPGDIAELGVFRGLGLMTWANMLEAYCIGDRTKIVYGFDNWSGFAELVKEDGEVDHAVQKVSGGFSPEHYFEEIQSAISIFDNDRFISWKKRIKLVRGNIEKTVPEFAEQNPGVRFSLIHFDCDVYRPTKTALEALWPRVSRGGVIIFDEYSIASWPGESQAVDEFFKDISSFRIRTFPWTNSPAGYYIKP